MQLLLYTSQTSSRLQYTCDFILGEILSIDYLITTNEADVQVHNGPVIRYEQTLTAGAHYSIGSTRLLFDTGIREQAIDCFEVNVYKAFFKTRDHHFPFDIFAASFYLLSRYEEYLPHQKDMYGRYAHENALAFKEDFLHRPLINEWINHFAETLQARFPGLAVQLPSFIFRPTYDIDMAYSYLHKGWLRNMGGFIKSPSIERIRVLSGLQKDPFDAYEWLDDLHATMSARPLYFFLLAQNNAVYDKNILPHRKAMLHLIKEHGEKYEVGIHPSWQTGDEPALINKEKTLLENMIGRPVTSSRQHYIRFSLPVGYRNLISSGITDDHSMGYGSINGFRASVAASFNWFDLEKNEATSLRIHPFCFMDANSFYEQHFTAAAAFEELMGYYERCKASNGQLITIWHNNFLGTGASFAGWASIYQSFILTLAGVEAEV